MFTYSSKIIIKREEKTDELLGFYPDKRPIKEHIENGVVNLDKTSGPTSHEVSAIVKKIFNMQKAGHGGTLDPAVTGVLPIMLNNATKIAKLWLSGTKEYVGTVHIHKEVDPQAVRAALKEFEGKITQLPPKRSSVKRAERERSVYSLEVLEIKEKDVLFKVSCEHGTYIRRICDDLGKKLGTGAHMTELRRTKASMFSEKERLVTLHDVKDAYVFYQEEGNEKFLRYCVQPLENALVNTPKIWVGDLIVNKLCNGVKLRGKDVLKISDNIQKGMTIGVMTLKDECIALATAEMNTSEILKIEDEIIARFERMIMPSTLYK